MNYKDKRREMVQKIEDFYGLNSPEVLDILLQIPRHDFVPQKYRGEAYEDRALPVGFGQTISQPYTVAFMSSLLISGTLGMKKPRKKVLEIGTGSGYQAAVLSKLFDKVYSVEIIPELALRTRSVLVRMGFVNVKVKIGNGNRGWKKYAPYEAIIITAGVNKVPDESFNQLKIGGILVAPVGKDYDKVMTRYTKTIRNENRNIKKSTDYGLQTTEKHKEIGYSKEDFGVFNFVPFVEEKNKLPA